MYINNKTEGESRSTKKQVYKLVMCGLVDLTFFFCLLISVKRFGVEMEKKTRPPRGPEGPASMKYTGIKR